MMTMTNTRKQDKLAKFLQLKQMEISQKRGRILNISDLARECSVPQPSLSQYFNADRIPTTAENVMNMANYFGWEIYDILEMRPFLPNTPGLEIVAKKFHKLPDSIREMAIKAAEALDD